MSGVHIDVQYTIFRIPMTLHPECELVDELVSVGKGFLWRFYAAKGPVCPTYMHNMHD